MYVFGMEPRENKTVIILLTGFRIRDGVFTAQYELGTMYNPGHSSYSAILAEYAVTYDTDATFPCFKNAFLQRSAR